MPTLLNKLEILSTDRKLWGIFELVCRNQDKFTSSAEPL